MRMTTRYPKVSNRQRQRLAQATIRQGQEIHALIIAILAQKGGEVTITPGTIAQIRPDMTFDVVIDKDDNRVIKLVSEGTRSTTTYHARPPLPSDDAHQKPEDTASDA